MANFLKDVAAPKSLGLRLVAKCPKFFVVEMKISINTAFSYLFQTALAGIKKSSELWSETTNSTELGYEYDDTRDRAWISKLDIEKSCIKHYIQFVLISFCGKAGARLTSQKENSQEGSLGEDPFVYFSCRKWAWVTIKEIQNFPYDQQHLWSHIPQNQNKQRHHNMIYCISKALRRERRFCD